MSIIIASAIKVAGSVVSQIDTMRATQEEIKELQLTCAAISAILKRIEEYVPHELSNFEIPIKIIQTSLEAALALLVRMEKKKGLKARAGRFIKARSQHREVSYLNARLNHRRQVLDTLLASMTAVRGKEKVEDNGPSECNYNDLALTLPGCRVFWEESFGSEEVEVSWDAFLDALRKKQTSPIDDDVATYLKEFLDYSHTDTVDVWDFKAFGGWFGDLALCVNNVLALGEHPWFHGFMPRVSAERVLEGAAPKTFLVRASPRMVGRFVVSYINRAGKMNHVLVNEYEQGYTMINTESKVPRDDQVFSSVVVMVASYRSKILEMICPREPGSIGIHGQEPGKVEEEEDEWA